MTHLKSSVNETGCTSSGSTGTGCVSSEGAPFVADAISAFSSLSDSAGSEAATCFLFLPNNPLPLGFPFSFKVPAVLGRLLLAIVAGAPVRSAGRRC